MNFTNEQRRHLIEKYPYLIPRNMWTGEVDPNYNYDYIRGEGEIPQGWRRLFLMYCKAIHKPLRESNMIEKFQFSQIKEKYGTLRLYNFGLPQSIYYLETIYECFSKYICQRCGQWADVQTSDWIESLCNDCYNKDPEYRVDKLNKPKWASVEDWNREKEFSTITNYSYKSLIQEYDKIKDMTDEEFFNYLIQ